jgi:hypothetical protein
MTVQPDYCILNYWSLVKNYIKRSLPSLGRLLIFQYIYIW